MAAHQGGGRVALATSGSTGRPRSVVRTTESWVASFPAFSALTGTGATSRVWVPGPLTATMNLFAAVHARFVGAGVESRPDHATHAQLTPSALRRCLDEGTPLDGVTVVVAGDRLPPALHGRAVAAGARVCHYYGAAELSFVGWGEHAAGLRPFPGVDVSVRDGEIWVRSPFLCSGYDGGLAGPLRRDGAGFATVGDRGVLSDGLLTVAGRDDAVTTAGATVHVADVEEHLRAAAFGEVVVVGLPHPQLGAVLVAVLTDPADHGPLRASARSGLAAVQRPRVWFHVAPLPQTAAGKVDRRALVAMVTSPSARRLV